MAVVVYLNYIPLYLVMSFYIYKVHTTKVLGQEWTLLHRHCFWRAFGSLWSPIVSPRQRA